MELFDNVQSRFSDLKRIRQSWEPTWRDIGDQFVPWRVRWNKSDWNKGNVSNSKIINNTPSLAVRVLASGMMAGITSPSREWFNLTLPDNDLAKYKTVKTYLDDWEKILRFTFSRSTWYASLADGVYRDLATFGTGLLLSEEDERVGVWYSARPMGEYWLDSNSRNEVDTLYRNLRMSVRQLVGEFGYDACSPMVRNAWDRSSYGESFDVLHCVQPNEEYVNGHMGSKGKPFRSVWVEESNPERQVLRDSGFYEFPAFIPRWTVNGNDVYGRGPGWEAIGDAKGLQFLELQLAKLVAKTAEPPMVGPERMRANGASLLPADMNYEPDASSGSFRPAMIVAPQSINVVKEDIARYEDHVNRAFFVDLWQRLIQDDRAQRATATEIEEVKRETMLQLGPVLENLNTGLLYPAIARTVAILQRRGVGPKPPREIQGMELQVEFISIMHQMQRMTGLSGVRTLVDEATRLAQMGREDVLDKLNADAILDDVAEMTGVKPSSIYSEQEVTKIREARAAREAEAQQQQQAMADAEGLQKLSQADPQKLSDLASSLSPVAAAQGGGLE